MIQKNIRKELSKGLIRLAFALPFVAGGEAALSTYHTHKLNERNMGVFSVKSMSLEDKLRQMMITTSYSNRVEARLGIFKKNPYVGGVQIYSRDARSLTQVKDTINRLGQDGLIPPLICMDVEGGFVNHLNLTKEDLVNHGIPQEILDLREEEANEGKNKLSALPSNEFLGKKYDSASEDGKKDLRRVMKGYGATMARILRDAGITINFAPVLDRAENSPDYPITRDSRGYSKNINTIRDLGFEYVQGYSTVGGTFSVPKHFFGIGLIKEDLHDGEGLSSEKKSGGAFYPYVDLIRGMDRAGSGKIVSLISREKDLEARIHWLKKDINYLEKLGRRSPKIAARFRNLIRKEKKEMEVKTREKSSLEGRIGSIEESGMEPVAGIMVSHAKTFLDRTAPMSMSKRALSFLESKNGYWNKGLAFNGIVITDDLKMNAVKDYLKSQGIRPNTLNRVYFAIAAGNDIALVRHEAGSIDGIVQGISERIRDHADLNGDGVPDITEAQINNSVDKILNLKANAGLIYRVSGEKEQRYILSGRSYHPSFYKSICDFLWTGQEFATKEDFAREGRTTQSFFERISHVSRKFYRFGGIAYTRLFERDHYSPEGVDKKLFVVDKSENKLFEFDLSTNKLIGETVVGVGRGTEKVGGEADDRKIYGDWKTPIGVYTVIQKRDKEWFEKNRGEKMHVEYGNGMIVLAGPWFPNIAIHGSNKETKGFVSNGCVRVSDDKLKGYFKAAPNGSYVIITP